jgi:hypothetical protein
MKNICTITKHEFKCLPSNVRGCINDMRYLECIGVWDRDRLSFDYKCLLPDRRCRFQNEDTRYISCTLVKSTLYIGD